METGEKIIGKKVGERIVYLREKKGYTCNALANRAGISQSFLREIELGSKNPTVLTVLSICEALGISMVECFDDETQERFESDPVFALVYALSPVQRAALFEFLKTLPLN